MTTMAAKTTHTTVLAAAAGATAAMLVAAASLVATPQPAEAFPAYAQRTGWHCSSCHVNPKGGGPLSPQGTKWFTTGMKVPKNKK